jgi:hypothetical protein
LEKKLLYKCLICGHVEKAHLDSAYPEYGQQWCRDCPIADYKSFKNWHAFKLDNLSYIEDLAAEKGLI